MTPTQTEPSDHPGLALYVHVPFCGQRCAYCHFDIKVLHPQTDPGPWFENYLAAVEKELASYGEAVADRPLTSIFFGGGTPSRLSPSSLSRLLATIRARFSWQRDIEINLEANPEDVTKEILWSWYRLGINRVSMGVQTFHDPSLQAIRRPHDADTARRAFQERPPFARGMSLDLMLGLPLQNWQTLQTDLQEITALEPEHLSVYMLERDLPTPLDALGKRLAMPSDDDQADFFEAVDAHLNALGFDHYEISNFAKPGFACRHNLVYWQCGDYLGVGPAAHGRIGRRYWANHKALSPYLAAVNATGQGVDWQEIWSPERFDQEKLVQGMRLKQGIPRAQVPLPARRKFAEFLEFGLLTESATHVALTTRGHLLANEVFAALIAADTQDAAPPAQGVGP